LWSEVASDRWGTGQDLSIGAKFLFGLAFRSGYTWMFQAAESQEAPSCSADSSKEPQIRERGEVCAVLCSC
jgi:hypothetical protein